MATNGTGIVPLNGGNYPTWKIQCKMALMKEHLWGIVSGTEEAPRGREDQGKFNERRERALAIVVLAVEPSLLYLLGEPEDPKVVWDALQGQFQRKTWANKLNLRRRLYNTKLKTGGSVKDHIRDLTEIFNEMAVVGDAVEEEDRVVHLLASLPEEYNMLVTALEASEKVPALETVTERLLHEERKRSGREEEKGLLTRRKGPAPNTSKGPMCYRCKKNGHIKRDCPENSKRREDNSKRRVKANAAKDDEVLVAYALNATDMCGGWLIDSGASSHMCNRKSQFSELQDIKPIDIVLGDGHALKATGIGTVPLTVRIPGGTQNCSLKEVLYVPGLAYSLFSISKLTAAGRTAVFDGQKCHIKSDSGRIIATGSRHGSLYHLSVEKEHMACTDSDDPKPRRSERGRPEPNMYGEWVTVAADLESPLIYRAAMQDGGSADWKNAMKKEMESLQSNKVRDQVPLHQGTSLERKRGAEILSNNQHAGRHPHQGTKSRAARKAPKRNECGEVLA